MRNFNSHFQYLYVVSQYSNYDTTFDNYHIVPKMGYVKQLVTVTVKLHEETKLNEDKFARRVNFARVLFFTRDGSKLHEGTNSHEQTTLHDGSCMKK